MSGAVGGGGGLTSRLVRLTPDIHGPLFARWAGLENEMPLLPPTMGEAMFGPHAACPCSRAPAPQTILAC